MAARDLIGKRGEAMVTARLTDFCGNPYPYFDVHPLGEKCPTFDYLVELIDHVRHECRTRDLLCTETRALTMMLLTRRADLLIEEVKDDIGLDYIVRFQTAGKKGLRELGIELRAVGSAVTKKYADKALRPAVQQMKRYGRFLFPVCLFFFTMQDEGAWYTWVTEPVVSENGKPTLQSCDQPDCRQLDDAALDQILERVDLWYDAAFPSLITNGANGNKANRKRTNR